MLQLKPWRACLWLIALLLMAAPVGAQSDGWAGLLPVDSDAFPEIRVYLDVHAGDENFVHGLQEEDIRLLENGQQLTLQQFREIRPGLQAVFALNTGKSFAVQDSRGVSRYDQIVNALQAWTRSREGTTLDDLSLLVRSGSTRSHVSEGSELIELLQQETQDFDAEQPTLDLLFQAVELASDTTPRPGMERAVVFITAPPAGDLAFGLESLLSLAQQQRVRIYIWLVASPDAFDLPAARNLQVLSEQTGGQYHAFSGWEGLPNPENYFASLRDIYELVYRSQIRQGGENELVVEIENAELSLRTEASTFSVDLQPPEPVFLTPPGQIVRSIPVETRTVFGEQPDSGELAPAEQDFQILIIFPDERARPLVKTALFVDEQLVDENTEPPFDRFTWDLSAYTQAGRHVLHVEAADALGLVGTSIETVVDVLVEAPQLNPWSGLALNAPLVAGLAGLLLLALVTLVLLFSGKIRPHALRSLPGRRGLRFGQQPDLKTPTVQEKPVLTTVSRGKIAGWVNRLRWPQRRLSPKAHAFLMPVIEDEQTDSVSPVPITTNECTLGRDRNLATLVLDDPSVNALHARLVRGEDGCYRLTDEGSVAGTWVNYSPVPEAGAVLEHGDRIHLGRVSFRFQLRLPERTYQITETEFDQGLVL
jgi:hypothetical protein